MTLNFSTLLKTETLNVITIEVKRSLLWKDIHMKNKIQKKNTHEKANFINLLRLKVMYEECICSSG